MHPRAPAPAVALPSDTEAIWSARRTLARSARTDRSRAEIMVGVIGEYSARVPLGSMEKPAAIVRSNTGAGVEDQP